jgi:LysR family hydrogen peroxide-inducible transcriptional activator
MRSISESVARAADAPSSVRCCAFDPSLSLPAPVRRFTHAQEQIVQPSPLNVRYSVTMTLRELRYLVALADHGHFGRAADACHVSQPTLSTQLKKLEGDLGVVLFERTNKALHITPIGREIINQARRVLAEADAIVELSRKMTAPLVGPLTLGVIPTLAPYLLPWLVPLLKVSYPDLRLILHEELTDSLIESLRAHRLDTAILSLPVPQEPFVARPLFDEPFFFVCPRQSPLAGCEAVTDAELRQERLLLLTDGHCLRDQALAICGQHEAAVEDDRADFRATSLETLRQMVAAGMGCTLLPALAVARLEDQPFAVRRLATGAARRIALVWRHTYSKADDLELIVALVREHLPPAVHAA